jgi:hypothetical protein
MNLFSKYVDKELWLECILAIPANEREVIELGFRSWGDE